MLNKYPVNSCFIGSLFDLSVPNILLIGQVFRYPKNFRRIVEMLSSVAFNGQFITICDIIFRKYPGQS